MKLFKKNEKKETLCKDTSMPFGKKEETTKLPMTGKVRKGFRFYCVMVMAGAMVLGTSMTAFAASDPLTVVNNLSDFIFGKLYAFVCGTCLVQQIGPYLFQPVPVHAHGYGRGR